MYFRERERESVCAYPTLSSHDSILFIQNHGLTFIEREREREKESVLDQPSILMNHLSFIQNHGLTLIEREREKEGVCLPNPPFSFIQYHGLTFIERERERVREMEGERERRKGEKGDLK